MTRYDSKTGQHKEESTTERSIETILRTKTIVNRYFSYLDVDHTFEDRLEVLLERLKESQTIGNN